MNRFAHGLRQALTIARRDFGATVMTPTFLLFLLSPLFMIGFGVVGSLSASTAATGGEERERIVLIAPTDTARVALAVDAQIRTLFTRAGVRPDLRIDPPAHDPAAQARAMIVDQGSDVTAILYGPLDRPHILHVPNAPENGRYLALLAEQTLRAERSGGVAPVSRPDIRVAVRQGVSSSGKSQAAYFAALGIFFLTLMLSGQVVGAMAEERSNKVIEVLAAAVPLESVFFGKLIGAFGSALLFVGFWGTLLGNLPRLLPSDFSGPLADLGTATGPLFPILFLAYFTMAYMQQSAVFVGLGALASTQREIQMLSLPITVFQFGMLGLASYAAGHGETGLALFARIFPFSSPLAMAAYAANSSLLWPHLLALAWQMLWVAITVTVAARVFRRGVLKSESPRWRLGRGRRVARG